MYIYIYIYIYVYIDLCIYTVYMFGYPPFMETHIDPMSIEYALVK